MDPKFFTNSPIQIINCKLNGNNYFQWSITVTVFIGSLGKDHYLTNDSLEIDSKTAMKSDKKKVAI